MPALLLVAFLVVPIAEIYVIVQVSHVIGGWETLALLIAESILGTWLVRREGRRTWRAFRGALEAGRSPTREVADGALVIVGGTLLLTPGFLSDVVGFVFLLPPTRPLGRVLILRWVTRGIARRSGGLFAAGLFPPERGRAGRPDPSVVDGEVVDGKAQDDQLTKRPRKNPPPGP